MPNTTTTNRGTGGQHRSLNSGGGQRRSQSSGTGGQRRSPSSGGGQRRSPSSGGGQRINPSSGGSSAKRASGGSGVQHRSQNRNIRRGPFKPTVKRPQIPKASPEEVFNFVRDMNTAGMAFYCRKCEGMLGLSQVEEMKRRGKSHFRCTVCKSEEIAYGPEASIRNYFKIKESKPIVA